jgi:hypothetical protein
LTKQFKIDISHASPGQLLTIAAELKIMANNWERFGPRIMINKRALEAPALRIEGSNKRATSAIMGTHSKGRISAIQNKC